MLPPETWLEAKPDSLERIAKGLRVPSRSVRYARECSRTAHHLAGREKTRSHNLGAQIVTRRNPLYPRALLDLELPPPALYILGELPTEPGVAVVGSRKADPYGIEVTEKFSGDLAVSGLVIVSGLALGGRGLVVEVDGGYHTQRRCADARRDRALERLGYRVLRLSDDLVLRDLPQAVQHVCDALAR